MRHNNTFEKHITLKLSFVHPAKLVNKLQDYSVSIHRPTMEKQSRRRVIEPYTEIKRKKAARARAHDQIARQTRLESPGLVLFFPHSRLAAAAYAAVYILFCPAFVSETEVFVRAAIMRIGEMCCCREPERLDVCRDYTALGGYLCFSRWIVLCISLFVRR